MIARLILQLLCEPRANRDSLGNFERVSGVSTHQSRLEVAVEVAVLADVPASVNVCVRRNCELVDTLFYRWRRGSGAGRAPLVVVGSRTTVALRRRVEEAAQPFAASRRCAIARTLLAS